jgi:hypothetical protein
MRSEDFERELDRALAKYGAAEPRAGLQQRVLANLRVDRAGKGASRWPRWAGFAVVGMAIAAAAAVVVWHGGSTVRRGPVAARDWKAAIGDYAGRPGDGDLKFQISNSRQLHGERRGAPIASAKRPLTRRVALSEAAVASDGGPKLGQFPAPAPLSEQEKLLMQYVQEDPENAELLAETVTLADQWRVAQAKLADRGATGPREP